MPRKRKDDPTKYEQASADNPVRVIVPSGAEVFLLGVWENKRRDDSAVAAFFRMTWQGLVCAEGRLCKSDEGNWFVAGPAVKRWGGKSTYWNKLWAFPRDDQPAVCKAVLEELGQVGEVG